MDLIGGYPYWLIKDGLPFDYPALDHDEKTEVLIMGGGISGALAAYFLVNEGVDCVLVDSRTIGLGSTCASTALLQYELDNPLCKLSELIGNDDAGRVYQLSSHAIDKLFGIMNEINFQKFTETPSLYFAAKNKHVAWMKKEFSERKRNNFKVKWLDEKDIRNTYGFSAPAAILSEQGATVNAYALTHALLQHAIKKGLRVFDRTEIILDSFYNGNNAVVKTKKGNTIKTNLLVNASGYEAVNLIGREFADLYSTYAIAGEQMPPEKKLWNNKAIIWNTDNPYLYMRMTHDNRVMAGGRDEHFKNPKLRDRLLERKVKLLAGDVKNLFPDSDFVPEFSWAGTFAVTKDSMPYIGTYAKFPHTFFALGFGGNGITFSVVAAGLLVDLVKGRKNKDAKLFSFERK